MRLARSLKKLGGMKPTILIIDDNKNQTLALKTHLQLKGYTAATASNLAEARAELSKSSFDVIVTDIHLSDGSGFDLLQDHPSGIIAMSGDVTQSQAALDAGFTAYLLKPFEIETLLTTIENIVKG